MARRALQAFEPALSRLPALGAVACLALATSGCLGRSGDLVTGSLGLGRSAPTTQEEWRREAESWGKRFAARPDDGAAAVNYARALRATDQRAQAAAVLEQAALRNPKDAGIAAAYGKALAETGRLQEAANVLGRAHSPDRPDWRILSALGAVADQSGDHALAQSYYGAALKIAPGEPSVLSNQGLSYALAKRLPEAETVLREASAHPRADLRVRQNFALVLGLQGKFGDAETVLRQDLAPEEASTHLASMKRLIAQQNSWSAIRGADARRGKSRG